MTKNDSPIHDRRAALIWWTLASIAVFVYFFGLTIPLVGPDEPRYAQVAREMFERGDWVTPTLGGFHWFEKPALLYWLEIGAYKIFGVSEFSARLGSALFGLGTVACLGILAQTIFSASRKRALNFAKWLSLIAASSIGIIVFARGASFDIVLTFPVTAAMVSFYIFDRRIVNSGSLTDSIADQVNAGNKISGRNAFFPLFLFYFFVGVSLLAKGLVGIVFPFGAVALYYLLSRRIPSKVLLVSLVWGTLLLTAVSSIWYWPVYQRNGWEFIDEFFIQHHFQRYLSNKYYHPQPFYFFFWVLPLMTIPWMPFFLLGVWQYLRSIFEPALPAQTELDGSGTEWSAVEESEIATLLRFAFAWMLVPLVFFSFSGSKLPGYILPSLPPALIITAVCVVRFARTARRKNALQAIALATFLIVVALTLFVVPRFADEDSVKGLIEAADESGFRSEKILALHRVSHNAEFYAPGRLVRDAAGGQKKLLGPGEVLNEIKNNGGQPVLVLVPLEYVRQVEDSTMFRSRVLRDNGELAIVYVESLQN